MGEERPREPFARGAHELGLGHCHWEEPSNAREDGQLALDTGDRDRPAWEAERPDVVDDPDRVVPALPEEAKRVPRELGELLLQ